MNLVATPWENTVGKTAKQRVLAVALLFLAVIVLSGLFASAAAKAQNVNDMKIMAQGGTTSTSTCERVVFAGDRHADGVKDAIEVTGVDNNDIVFLTQPGASISDVTEALREENFSSTDCVIIDAGLADARDLNTGDATEDEIRDLIDAALEATSQAGQVTWTTPIVADEFPEDSSFNRDDWNTDRFNEILEEVIDSGDYPNATIADITDLSGSDNFEDGIQMNDDGYAERLAEILRSIENNNPNGENIVRDFLNDLDDDELRDTLLDLLDKDESFLDEDPELTAPPVPTDTDEPGDSVGGEDEDGDNAGGGDNTGGNAGGGDNTGGNSGGGDNSGGGNNSGGGLPGLPGSGGGGGNFSRDGSVSNYGSVNSAPKIGGGADETGFDDEGAGEDTDKINGDVNIMSPASMANKIESAQGFDYANNYLAMVRWNSFPLPSPGLNPLSGGDILNSIMASFAQMLFTMMGSLAAAIVGFFTVCFSNFFGSIFLRLGDMLFGAVIGGLFSGGGDIARASALISAMVTVALVTSAMAAFDTKNAGRSLQSRIMSVIMAVAKVIVFFIVVGGIGIQSAKNYGGSITPEQAAQEGAEDVADQLREEGGIAPVDGNTSGIVFNTDGGMQSETTEVRSKTLTDASSWEPLSMGWIVSVILDIANMMINAILGLFNSIVMFPISALATSLDRVTNDPEAHGTQNPPLPACDRYVDAMHYAYQNSSAAQDSMIFSQLMVSLDTIYTRSVLSSYGIGYGNTLSGNNTWCHMLENANGSSAGDRLMLGRTAGLWWEVAGDGNLLGGRPGVFSTGVHNLGGINANMEPSIAAGRNGDGALVNSAGEWQAYGTNNNEAPVRANVFFGKASMTGLPDDNPTKAADTALYYFGACEWNPRTGNTYLNREWGGSKVKAMPSADPDYEDTNNYLSVDQASDIYESGAGDATAGFSGPAVGATAHSGNGTLLEHSQVQFNNLVASSAEDGQANASQYIQNVDCYNIANFPVGHFESGNDFGWGANNRMSDRWYYAPINPNLLAQTVNRATSTSPALIRGIVNFATGQGDEVAAAERDSKAENAFAGAEDPELNKNFAQEYWLATIGRGGSGHVLGAAFFAIAAFICVIIFMIPSALIGLVIHLVFGLLLAIAPAIVLLNVLLRTIRGGR